MTFEIIPRVKICGITTQADAQHAVNSGADALGFVFYEPSPRSIAPAAAREIALSVGPLITTIGLFVNASYEDVSSTLDQVPLSVLQFHGDETNEFCRQFSRPFIKAFRMAPGFDVEPALEQYPDASGFILDAYKPGVPGGTGQSFEWHRFPRESDRPLILAGGLNPSNVEGAIVATKPYGVDVSGGVELAPGHKDPEKVMAFINAVKHPPWR
ncbi:phosphoribosylanthranilate isomerase [Sessilibacter corallicola]|uniref:phosphoribosylanthranilate isomerase n=1 Tax=Sessilibacter corallicola TaxID=2904075 RepID=UPI001E4A3BF1|nr:phosphoribosylanthranilate isomerase [Sessilibacter corallicola]MCE2026911.1 phosphoribosylanthranilate isomerase [Sessilibacter corallicola]